VMVRTARYWTGHITLWGDVDLESINQDARAASAAGEGFADFVGLDFGI
jgi:uncharacterized membrane protein YjgN (DUF898 family)